MKTEIMGDVGRIHLQTSTYAKKTINFQTDTLQNWYPLELNYEYKFNPTTNRMYLAPLEAKQESWVYGITSTLGRVNSEVATFELDTWYCKEVAEDNKKVFKQASKLGLTTMDENYTVREVTNNYKILQKLISNYIKPVIHSRMEREATVEEIITYRKMDYEEKDQFLYSFSSVYEDEQLKLLGKCYVMTNFMRKRVE